MNYHDENRSQTQSLAAPTYSTKDTRKDWTFSFDIKICLFLNLGIKNEPGSAKRCVYKLFYHDNSTHQGR